MFDFYDKVRMMVMKEGGLRIREEGQAGGFGQTGLAGEQRGLAGQWEQTVLRSRTGGQAGLTGQAGSAGERTGLGLAGLGGRPGKPALLGGQPGLMEKLGILADAAKYDVACTSSGVERQGNGKGMGNCLAAGICHSFSSDGRCISLLKILMTNECVYDCKYCQNRRSNDVPRAAFTPEEICTLTMEFYRRNYIEGLFLSSGVMRDPGFTMERIYETLLLLRRKYGFRGYIHVKAIPGADEELVRRAGLLADRMSVNLELPTAESLQRLAPNKHRKTILTPMRMIQNGIRENRNDLILYRHAPAFVPGGQSTQMIIGATPESDYQILRVAESLYEKFELKRVFYSAFVNVTQDASLPALPGGPPLLREHRLYQADWLLRFYGFRAEELLDEKRPFFNVLLDPKEDWAVRHLEQFPIEINRAPYQQLLRVPGIGVKSAKRILAARRCAALTFQDLKRIGVVLKRAMYFITCSGRLLYPLKLDEDVIVRSLTSPGDRMQFGSDGMTYRQMSLFDDGNFWGPQTGKPGPEDVLRTVNGQL